MRRGLTMLAAVVLVPALAVHAFVLWWMPSFIMGLTLGDFAEQGLVANRWKAAAPVSPQNQPVARADPNLAHALCRLDPSKGPVLVSAPGWDRFASLSVYDGRAENVFVIGLDGAGAEIVVALKGQTVTQRADRPVVWLEAPEGLALVRRLAPTPALQARAAARVAESECAPI